MSEGSRPGIAPTRFAGWGQTLSKCRMIRHFFPLAEAALNQSPPPPELPPPREPKGLLLNPPPE